MNMDSKDLQEVVDSILQAMLLMEERINKRFDAVNEKLEIMSEDIEDIKSDIKIIGGTMDKQDRRIKKIERITMQ
jgi:hypothetical protein